MLCCVFLLPLLLPLSCYSLHINCAITNNDLFSFVKHTFYNVLVLCVTLFNFFLFIQSEQKHVHHCVFGPFFIWLVCYMMCSCKCYFFSSFWSLLRTKKKEWIHRHRHNHVNKIMLTDDDDDDGENKTHSAVTNVISGIIRWLAGFSLHRIAPKINI